MKTVQKLLAPMALAGFLIALVGCGVNKDEHQQVVTELTETKALLDKANDRIAQLEKSLMAAQAQAKTSAKESVKVETPTNTDPEMQAKLAAAQQDATNLRAKVESLTNENSNLKSI